MNKSLIFAGLALVTILAGVALTNSDQINSYLRKELQQPDTVPYVDLNTYMEGWSQRAVLPFYFERGCSYTNATYSINPDGKTVKVENKCTKNGRLQSATGKAIPEDSTNSKLKVEFIQTLDIGGQYWIVRLGKNYEYSVVSSPNYTNLWILSRDRKLDETVYQSIIADLRKNNFPVDKLVRTVQWKLWSWTSYIDSWLKIYLLFNTFFFIKLFDSSNILFFIDFWYIQYIIYSSYNLTPLQTFITST